MPGFNSSSFQKSFFIANFRSDHRRSLPPAIDCHHDWVVGKVETSRRACDGYARFEALNFRLPISRVASTLRQGACVGQGPEERGTTEMVL